MVGQLVGIDGEKVEYGSVEADGGAHASQLSAGKSRQYVSRIREKVSGGMTDFRDDIHGVIERQGVNGPVVGGRVVSTGEIGTDPKGIVQTAALVAVVDEVVQVECGKGFPAGNRLTGYGIPCHRMITGGTGEQYQPGRLVLVGGLFRNRDEDRIRTGPAGIDRLHGQGGSHDGGIQVGAGDSAPDQGVVVARYQEGTQVQGGERMRPDGLLFRDGQERNRDVAVGPDGEKLGVGYASPGLVGLKNKGFLDGINLILRLQVSLERKCLPNDLVGIDGNHVETAGTGDWLPDTPHFAADEDGDGIGLGPKDTVNDQAGHHRCGVLVIGGDHEPGGCLCMYTVGEEKEEGCRPDDSFHSDDVKGTGAGHLLSPAGRRIPQDFRMKATVPTAHADPGGSDEMFRFPIPARPPASCGGPIRSAGKGYRIRGQVPPFPGVPYSVRAPHFARIPAQGVPYDPKYGGSPLRCHG